MVSYSAIANGSGNTSDASRGRRYIFPHLEQPDFENKADGIADGGTEV